MRYFVYTLLAVALGIGFVSFNQYYAENYVKVYVGGYVVEMSFLALLLGITLAVITLWLLVRMLHAIIVAPSRYGRWRRQRKIRISDKDLGSGYLSLIKGDWKAAEKRLTLHADDSPIPYVSYLAAAQAAQEQGKLNQRDEYLSKAYKAAPKETLAIGLTKARLHQSAGQWNMARATLEDIAEQGRNNAQFTAMLIQVYEHAGSWGELKKLLPVARKQQALSEEVLHRLDDDVYLDSLDSAIDIDAAWRALPRHQRKKTNVIARYCNHLINAKRDAQAEKLIVSTMKKEWSDELVELYARLVPSAPVKARRVAEGWLLAQPENPWVNLAAGQHALHEGNSELAKKYLQAAITYGGLPQAYRLLGELFDSVGERGKALELYRSGLLQDSVRALPAQSLSDNA